MNFLDKIEADDRRKANAFTMKVARKRYRNEIHYHSFAEWARRTYNAFACTGKLEKIVAKKI